MPHGPFTRREDGRGVAARIHASHVNELQESLEDTYKVAEVDAGLALKADGAATTAALATKAAQTSLDTTNTTVTAHTGQISAVTTTADRSDTRVFDARKYGDIDPTGVTDCSTAWQAAIAAAAAADGGEVTGPPGIYKVNLVLDAGVILRGPGRQYITGSMRGITFVSGSGDIVIDTPLTEVRSCGIVGANVEGRITGNNVGVRFRNVVKGVIKEVTVNLTADEGILVDAASGACVLSDVQVVNGLRNRANRVAVAGAVDLSGTDHDVRNVEATASSSVEGTVTSVNLYCAAFALRTTNAYYRALMGEVSDVGIYLTGTLNKLDSCRADLNYGHGWWVTGTSNQFGNPHAHNNSRAGSGTYDSFWFTSTTSRNQTTNLKSSSSGTGVPRYGLKDDLQSTAKNQHVSPLFQGTHTAAFNFAASNQSAVLLPRGGTKALTANSATPSVEGYEFFITANTLPTTITAFTGIFPGQRILIYCADSNTTVDHNGSTISTSTGADVVLVSGKFYEFIAFGNTLVRQVTLA